MFAMDAAGHRAAATRRRPTSRASFEWGVSVGLIAATIFLFGLGARLMPVLPKEESASH